ncbi:MAG TPA: penicillin-binding protein 1C [Tepidisphaeraceae bacterium]|nr:penicillin-binding protein 1C [Tepidisphaeraceae bacterium]
MLVSPVAAFRAAVAWLPYASESSTSPPASTLVLDRTGEPLFASAAFDGQWRMPLQADQINPDLINAIIAVEDSRFKNHAGVDWRSIFAAAVNDIAHLSIRRGGSTLTMQLARLRDPRPRTFFWKFDQAIRAEQIERRSGKKTILIEYLNRAPFGVNLVGAGAESWRYFNKPCNNLSLAQCALLAGLPQAPNRLRPDRFPDLAKIRRDHVLDRMLTLKMISSQRHDQALAETIDAKWNPLPQQSDSSSIGVLPAAISIAELHRGQTTQTTIDLGIQKQAARITNDRLHQLAASGVSAAAVVILDTQTAQLLAAVSLSADAKNVDLTRASRSTGSTLKPFIYAAAFDAGLVTPESVLDDAPAAWPGYEPANYDRAFRGPLNPPAALAESRNIPAISLLSRVGIPRAINVMEALGLKTLARTPDRFGLPLAIGGAEATPLELAEAYATLARAGQHRPITFLPISTSPPRHETTPILLPASCYATLAAIASPDRTAAICPEAARSNAAWKTGTSSGHRDAWCAAVTQNRTVVVWLGNASGRRSAALVGADAAAPVALAIIAAIDPIDSPWPALKTNESSTPHTSVASNPSLTIVSPANGSELLVSDDEKSSHHSIELRSNPIAQGVGGRVPWWFVDGQSIGSGNSVEWIPTPGPHEILALDEEGRSAITRVRVR